MISAGDYPDAGRMPLITAISFFLLPLLIDNIWHSARRGAWLTVVTLFQE